MAIVFNQMVTISQRDRSCQAQPGWFTLCLLGSLCPLSLSNLPPSPLILLILLPHLCFCILWLIQQLDSPSLSCCCFCYSSFPTPHLPSSLLGYNLSASPTISSVCSSTWAVMRQQKFQLPFSCLNYLSPPVFLCFHPPFSITLFCSHVVSLSLPFTIENVIIMVHHSLDLSSWKKIPLQPYCNHKCRGNKRNYNQLSWF